MKIASIKGIAPLIAIIIVTLIIGTGIIVYQFSKTRNEAITTNTSTTLSTSTIMLTTLPTPPDNWVSFSDTKLGVEFKVPSDVKIGMYEPKIHSYSDYYSNVNMILNSDTTAKDKAQYYYNLYQTGGTTLKIFYNNTGDKLDKIKNKLLVVFNNPSQLSFNEWKNTFEYCNAYNPSINFFWSDACPHLECICNGDSQLKYDIFKKIQNDNFTVYLGNNGYNFIAFLPLKDKVYIVSKAYQHDLESPSLSIDEAKNDFLNSRELKILSSLKSLSK